VFSLGVVLYEMLTDRKPFRGDTLEQITGAVLDHSPQLAHEVDAQVPEALSRIADRAMAKDKEARYRSARALSRELRHWLEEQTLGANPAAAPLSEPMPAPGQKRKAPALALAAGLAAVAAIGAWAVLGHDGGGSGQASAASAPAPAMTAAASSALPSLPAQSTAAGPTAPAPAADAVATPASAAVEPPPLPIEVAQATEPKPKPAAAPKPAKPPRDAKATKRETKAAAPAAPAATGTVRIAVSPWGQVEVDGASVGTTPPLNELSLPEGKHQITIRNADFPPHAVTVNVTAGQPVVLKHRFGS
jgi:serine/threonine-protein kinase